MQARHHPLLLLAAAAAQRLQLQRLAGYGVEPYHFHEGLIEQAPAKPGTVSRDDRSCNHQAESPARQWQDDRDLCCQNRGGQVTYATQSVANWE